MIKSFKQFVKEPKEEEKPFFYWANAKLKHSKYPYSPDNAENKIELSDLEKEQEEKRKAYRLKEDAQDDFSRMMQARFEQYQRIHATPAELAPHEAKALRQYTENASHRINHVLHDSYHGRTNEFKSMYQSHIDTLDAAFANPKNHVQVDHVVYSGVPESPARVIDMERKRLKLKDTDPDPPVHVHLPAFTSTSTDSGQAVEFAKIHGNTGVKHVLKIQVPKGHPSISVRHLSSFPSEEEVLLHRGTQLKIDPIPHKGDRYGHPVHTWNATVVGHNLNATVNDLNSTLDDESKLKTEKPKGNWDVWKKTWRSDAPRQPSTKGSFDA